MNQKINSDSNILIGFCITVLQSTLVNAVVLIVPFIILLTMNWHTTVLMLMFLVVYMLTYKAFQKPLYNAGSAYREAQSKFFSKMFEQLTYVKLIKINSIQPEINQRADNSFADMRAKAVSNQKISHIYSGLGGFTSTIAQIVLFVIGGTQILAGNFTIGMFTIFTSYFNMMLQASKYFFGLGAYYQNTMVSHDRIEEIYSHKPENCGLGRINDISNIELKDVSFSYEGCDEKKVISNFNAMFAKGNIYAIKGTNGAGKSTLISILMGLYVDEYTGSITYDGVDIRQIEMKQARKNLFGFAEQEPTLINDSVRYNMYFNHDEPTSQPLESHISTLNMQNFYSKNGLDFIINEKNSNTSGGEKQKISILKVLCKDPAVMIFDEPTSALDALTTKSLMNYLQQVKKDKIIILITHDEFVKGCCDKVVSLLPKRL